MRTGLFDLLNKRAKENGIDVTSKAHLEPLGKMINSLTARGQWGKRGEPAIVRVFLWAPKMIKANLDVLTAHGAGVGLKSKFARKQAAILETMRLKKKELREEREETRIQIALEQLEAIPGAGGLRDWAERNYGPFADSLDEADEVMRAINAPTNM